MRMNWRPLNCFLLLFFVINLSAQPTKMNLLGHWRDSAIVGSNDHNNAFNEVWGFWVNNHEYAVLGSTAGTHLIDVTDPANPFERMLIPGKFNGSGVVHRDYDDYKCHLYAVCDEGGSSLQIIDFSNLPDTAIVVYDSSEFMTRVHNIYIDIPKGRLYTLAEQGVKGAKALGLYDISTPHQPKFIGHYNKFGDITAGHVHDAYAINDTAYLNCGNDGFAIVDFSDPANPNAIFTAAPNEYPFAGYNHSGWLTPDRKTYVMADENHGLPLKIMDVSEITESKTISLLYPSKDSSIAIPHNPLVSCDYAYVAYYYDGLQVFNIKDPKNPSLDYFYPTSTIKNNRRYMGAWGVYPYLPSGNILVADMQNGLFILEGIEKLCNPVHNCLPVWSDQSQTNNELSLYPNPTQDYIRLSSTDLLDFQSYTITSTTGQLLLSGKFLNTSIKTIELHSLNPGMYFLKVLASGKEPISRSFIKMN